MTDPNVTSTVSHVGAQPAGTPPTAGHNTTTGKPSVPAESGVLAKDQLKSIVARIEQAEEEKATIAEDISEMYTEAEGNGFDVKALRTIIRLRKTRRSAASAKP
jgi:uncharacterized protein (UPF0335 family)